MKIFVLSVFICFSIYGFSQSLEDVPKKTKKIIVNNKLSADENFMLVGQTLINAGYVIKSKDKEFYTMVSDYKKSTKLNFSVSLSFIIKNNSIVIIGFMDMGQFGNSEIKKFGMRGSPALLSFEQMFDFALLLTHDSFSYSSE